MNRTPSILTLAALVLATSAGCAASRIRPEPALGAVAAVPVSGANPRHWGSTIRFGGYETGKVGGDVKTGWSLGFARGAALAGTERPFGWTSHGPGGALDAECRQVALEARRAGFSLDLRGASGQDALACAFRPAGAAAAWTLGLRATGKGEPGFAGELSGPGGTYAVRSVHRLEGGSLPLHVPAGYVLERDGQVVAMVETINAGRVWLPGGADEAPIAAAATALLLFNPDERAE